jgi:multiple antibiotic resistance protein
MSDLGFLAAVIVSLFVLVDPIGTLPFYVALTQGYEEADRREVIRRTIIVVATILALFAVAGRFLFQTFGFTLGAFEIAGGIILFAVAFDMLRGETTPTRLTSTDRTEALARRNEISVVPLGIPLLAGPGAISTVMIYEGYAGNNPWEIAATFIAIGVATAATFVVLTYGNRILRYLGQVGVMALTRVLGLILAAIAVQFVLNGIVYSFPGA